MNIGVVPLGYGWLGLDFGLSDVFGDPVDMYGRVAADVLGDPVTMQGLVYASFVGVGATIATATNITGKLYDIKPFGFGLKIKDNSVPGSRTTVKTHQGAEGPGISFLVKWIADRNAASNFQYQLTLIDPEDNIRFYHRDSLWYLPIWRAGISPYFDDKRSDRWGHLVKIWLKDPFMYSEIHQDWTVVAGNLPQVSEAMDNYGHQADGFETLTVTGHHDWDKHCNMEDLVLSVADGDSITLSDNLLGEEKITLGVDGSLVTEWTANMTSFATFWTDTIANANTTFSGDHIVIAASGYVVIALYGPWPTLNAVKMAARLTIAGTASVQVSTDGGLIYSEAVTTANIESGELAVYYLAGSVKAADIRIKFNCPSASTMLIHSLKIERELDCSGADLPAVEPGEAKAFTLSCDVTKSMSADIVGEFHPRREAI